MKSTLSYQPYPTARTHGQRPVLTRMADFIGRALETRRTRKALRDLPDAVLRDIGAERDQIDATHDRRLRPRDFPGGGYQ